MFTFRKCSAHVANILQNVYKDVCSTANMDNLPEVVKMDKEELLEWLEERPMMAVLLDVLDYVLKRAEKANPSLPESAVDLVTSGLAKKTDWWGLYYVEEDELWKLFNERVGAWKRYYEKLWEAYDELDSGFVGPPALTPDTIEREKGLMYILYMPTSSREFFEEMKEMVSGCEDLNCIFERFEGGGA